MLYCLCILCNLTAFVQGYPLPQEDFALRVEYGAHPKGGSKGGPRQGPCGLYPQCADTRPLTADERATVETGLRSSSAGTVRRCQRLLASAEG